MSFLKPAPAVLLSTCVRFMSDEAAWILTGALMAGASDGVLISYPSIPVVCTTWNKVQALGANRDCGRLVDATGWIEICVLLEEGMASSWCSRCGCTDFGCCLHGLDVLGEDASWLRDRSRFGNTVV